MFVAQGTGGQLDATQPSAAYGPGDGVMIAGTHAPNDCATIAPGNSLTTVPQSAG